TAALAPASTGRALMTQAGPGGVAGRAKAPALLLVILCAVQFVDAYDIAAMGPAPPQIHSDLGMTPEALQWVATAYVLGYGGSCSVAVAGSPGQARPAVSAPAGSRGPLAEGICYEQNGGFHRVR